MTVPSRNSLIHGVWVAIAILLTVSPSTHAIHFELQARSQKCLGEEVERNDIIVAKFKSMEGRKLTTTVLDSRGQSLYSKTTASGKYTITSKENGEHRTCFFNTEALPTTVEFSVKTGLGAKDYSGIAQKDNLKPIELELLRLEDIINYIQAEFKRLEANEVEQAAINASTNSRVFWLSILSMLCIVGVNAAQIYFLVQYFRDKRFKDM
eukprot:CAMPEP_0185263552 /NCGR_PEP_ID=MMETSP1359-20130426/15285_1 /TAXON_ID=552665 /ORGANISM="Bigelowiella longifila, Strain CCMP242" /LENGTH=208 /DNA_ID=CAMNT_0027851161 /DNA_START=28 /DNA_END=654 /DNA_ORIENTATION=-